MKPQALILFFLVAALGAVAYFALRDQGDLAPKDSPNGAGTSQPGSPTSQQAAVEAANVGSKDGAVVDSEGVTRTAAPNATPVEASAKSGRLRARIVDRDGAARAGVELIVDTFPDFANVTDLVDGVLASDQVRQDATTDADGVFEVRVPVGREGTLSLPGDLVFAERQRFKTTAAEQDLGDLMVVQPARITGVVQAEGGVPLAGIKVEAVLGGLGLGTSSMATSGDDGTFAIGKLRPGKWELRTISNQHLPASETFEMAMEEQREGVVLTLSKGRTVIGRVVDDRGVGVPDMKVASQRRKVVGGVEIERFSGDEAAVTDEFGNFTLAGLDGETVTLRAYGPGHTKVTKPNVRTGAGNVELLVRRHGSIAGVLVTAAGTPIVGSRVATSTASKRPGMAAAALEMADVEIPGQGASATTDEQGKFVLEGVKPGLVTVKATGKAHLPVERGGVAVEPGASVEGVRLSADAGATARVHVVDGDGEAIVGAKVSVNKAPEPATSGMTFSVRARSSGGSGEFEIGGRALGSGTTDEQGIATIMGLPAGDMVVDAKHAEFAPSDQAPLTLPESGASELQIALQAPSYVDVVVTRLDGSPAVGTEVLLERPGAASPADGSPATPAIPGFGDDDKTQVEKKVTDADGKLRFGPVAGGNYVAVLSRGQRGRSIGNMMIFAGNQSDKIASSATPLSVRAGEAVSVELKFPVLTQLVGRVTGSDGPVANCGVELGEGSSVAGVGGRQVKTDTDGNYVFEGLESGSYVLRYGKTDQLIKAKQDLEIPANVPEMRQDLLLRTGRVRVQVLTQDDAEPVDRAEVRLSRGDAAPASGSRPQRIMMVGFTSNGEGGEETSTMTFGDERVMTDEDGVAVFEDVPVGDYTLKVKSRSFAPAEKTDVSVVERQLTDCGTIEVSGAGQIRGVVTDAAGKQVMARVEHRLVGSEEWGRGEIAMRGSYRLRGLTPGDYEVRANALATPNSKPCDPVRVTVRVRKTEVVNLTLP